LLQTLRKGRNNREMGKSNKIYYSRQRKESNSSRQGRKRTNSSIERLKRTNCSTKRGKKYSRKM